MNDIIKVFAEQELSPLDAASLTKIHQELKRIGIDATITQSGTVCAELKAFNETYALAHFVSAREIFYRDEYVDRYKERSDYRLHQELLQKLHCKQRLWVELDAEKFSKLDKYIFVVDSDGVTSRDEYGVFRVEVENDLFRAKKVLCTLDALREVVSSPFNPVAHRANVEPAVYCTLASTLPFNPPKADFNDTVTAVFRPADYPAMCDALTKRGNSKAIKALVGNLFQRVMGAEYRLIDGTAWPEVSQSISKLGLPYFLLSNGEQVALSFCLFLALAHDEVGEGLCIGIRESLNSLDTLRQLNAYDCLRFFVVATGSSVYLQSDNAQNLQLAERKLTLAKNLARRAGPAIFA
jgi:hypothetical protein